MRTSLYSQYLPGACKGRLPPLGPPAGRGSCATFRQRSTWSGRPKQLPSHSLVCSSRWRQVMGALCGVSKPMPGSCAATGRSTSGSSPRAFATPASRARQVLATLNVWSGRPGWPQLAISTPCCHTTPLQGPRSCTGPRRQFQGGGSSWCTPKRRGSRSGSRVQGVSWASAKAVANARGCKAGVVMGGSLGAATLSACQTIAFRRQFEMLECPPGVDHGQSLSRSRRRTADIPRGTP